MEMAEESFEVQQKLPATNLSTCNSRHLQTAQKVKKELHTAYYQVSNGKNFSKDKQKLKPERELSKILDELTKLNK